MNKTAIKNFAIWARNKLIADISYRAGLMGITESGIASALPQSTGDTEFYEIGTAEPYAIHGEEIKQRQRLVEVIRQKEADSDYATAFKYIIEEVAYTWFNRLIAVRFMEANDYLPSRIRVLSSETGKLEPDLVTNPFDSNLEFTSAEEEAIIGYKQNNQLDEAFRLLFRKQCNALHEILPVLFETTSDYTELLLNLSIIDQEGVVYHLVHDIPEEDFNIEQGGQVEIIGWLYQYYNTEPKVDAFAKKGKITKEEIPAVTQLFTPDWIVRYMVENSLGRLWAEGHPETADALKANWKYYLEEAEQEPEVQEKLAEIRKEYAALNPEDLSFADICAGSGHILVYGFDVLMQIYESAGYSQRDAAQSILEHNIYGLDIDDRAAQLAYFAVMMKARQYDRRIFSRGIQPHVYAIQESNTVNRAQLKYFGAGMSEIEKNTATMQMEALLDTLVDAKEYGSILGVENYDWALLRRFVEDLDVTGQISLDSVGADETAEQLKALIDIGETMARKYWVTCTNPPYATVSNLSPKVNNFVKKNYPDSKADFFAVFIERCHEMTRQNGYQAMITQHAWMFLASYEGLREKLLQMELVNLAHLGPHAFDEINGEVVQTSSFVFCNVRFSKYRSQYIRLVDGKNEVAKANMFLSNNSRFAKTNEQLKEIKGAPYTSYWASNTVLDAFRSSQLVGEIAEPRVGMATANNDRFIRLWFEVDHNKFGEGIPSREQAVKSRKKWFPFAKGGEQRKWYGNNDTVVNWENDGIEIQNFKDEKTGRIRSHNYNLDYIFSSALTWTVIGTEKTSFRFCPVGFLYSNSGYGMFCNDDEIKYYLLGFMNSKIAASLLKILSPSMGFESGYLRKIPLVEITNKNEVIKIVKECIKESNLDWDAFETSWDFKEHPLVPSAREKQEQLDSQFASSRMEKFGQISWHYDRWKETCNERFNQLKSNEEELNRIFIDIYGLQDELTPEVEDNDVTVRKADLPRDVKSLLSYAVGCMFGRYSLDVDGLVYAGGEWDNSKYKTFIPDADNVIPITDEEYLEDDIVARLCDWLKVVYGADTLEANLDFIAKALGNKGNTSRETIRNYFLNDFFKDHCQTYSVTGSGKRPIYWLFDSGKQNGFKALTYLHRYTPDDIGNLRIDYLHRMQRVYESEMGRMQDMIDHSTNAREVATATKRKEKLAKQLKECREYDEKIGHLALSRIELDLDDGVKVNYRKLQTVQDGKFYEVLADSRNIMVKEKNN